MITDPAGEDVIYGFHFTVTAPDGVTLSIPSVTILAIAGVTLFCLMAMVFRNVFNTSRGATPFQPDVIRMLREIGIFSIAVPAVGLIMSIAGRLVVGPELAEGSVLWLLVLWLTQVFAYGAELQGQTDGLI